MPTGQSTYFNDCITYNGYPNKYIYWDNVNPFRGVNCLGQCTWYSWSKAQAKAFAYPSRNLQSYLLPTSHAYKWYSQAAANGLTVSATTPKKDSIAVWGNYNNNLGHVAYVEDWDGTNICYSEANVRDPGIPANDNCIRVDSSVYTTIESFVAYMNSTLGTYVTVYSGGYDGLFHTKTKSNFESKQSLFLGYIYLN